MPIDSERETKHRAGTNARLVLDDDGSIRGRVETPEGDSPASFSVALALSPPMQFGEGGEFLLKDAAGAQIGTYSVRKTYAGGAGIGGAGFLDMDDLAKKLADASADSLDGWEKTGKFAEQ